MYESFRPSSLDKNPWGSKPELQRFLGINDEEWNRLEDGIRQRQIAVFRYYRSFYGRNSIQQYNLNVFRRVRDELNETVRANPLKNQRAVKIHPLRPVKTYPVKRKDVINVR